MRMLPQIFVALITLSLFIIITPVVAHAQEQTSPADAAQLNNPVCTQELFEKAEASFRMRWRGSEMLYKAEQELKGIVRRCADTQWRYQAEEHLKVAQEELANSNLTIARFYLKRFHEGKSKNLKGVRVRLAAIVERYSHYSHMAEVLSLLGEVNILEDDLDEAVGYYRRIINDFPASQYVGEAYRQLNAIEAMRQERGNSRKP